VPFCQSFFDDARHHRDSARVREDNVLSFECTLPAASVTVDQPRKIQGATALFPLAGSHSLGELKVPRPMLRRT
jgi:hypothetical protein